MSAFGSCLVITPNLLTVLLVHSNEMVDGQNDAQPPEVSVSVKTNVVNNGKSLVIATCPIQNKQILIIYLYS